MTAGNNARAIAEFEYDNGYNNFDVRHTFNFSALYNTSRARGALTGGWSVGGILNARSGLPIAGHSSRALTSSTSMARGNVFTQPGGGPHGRDQHAGRRHVAQPRGGRTWSPAWIPFIQDGGLLFLNPAAFATPKPGTFGNLERNAIHGPDDRARSTWWSSKRVPIGAHQRRVPLGDVQPVQPRPTSPTRPSTLPNALPSNSADRSEQGAAGRSAQRGRRRRHVRPLHQHGGTTVGLGTNRQVQLAFRLNF